MKTIEESEKKVGFKVMQMNVNLSISIFAIRGFSKTFEILELNSNRFYHQIRYSFHFISFHFFCHCRCFHSFQSSRQAIVERNKWNERDLIKILTLEMSTSIG